MMKLEELEVYKRSIDIAEEIWKQIMSWQYFEKTTIGKQIVRSADSISANISEGYGRYHFKEKKHFAYFSRGSLYETQTWLVKAHNRNLIDDERFTHLETELTVLGKMLNAYINSIGTVKR